jgi:hypothetical protein
VCVCVWEKKSSNKLKGRKNRGRPRARQVNERVNIKQIRNRKNDFSSITPLGIRAKVSYLPRGKVRSGKEPSGNARKDR